MSVDAWHTGIDAKIKGAWNLHNALRRKDSHLDFFLMTSSIAGSIGTATESNYCAANSFLDWFARYRRSIGLPATSIGLGAIREVGYLHEHPHIEALLLRKGVHPINEGELLQMIDIALTPNDDFTDAHLLSGLELLGLHRIQRMGFERPTHVLADPRCGVISGAFAQATNRNDGPKVRGVSDALYAALQARASAKTSGDGVMSAESENQLLDVVDEIVKEKIAGLLLLPAAKLTSDKPLSGFGMDSMLAAEFRTALFKVFKVDIPFAVILDQRTTVGALVDRVVREL